MIKKEGIATDKDIHEMIRAGISERSAKRIARETEHALITLQYM